MTLFCKETQCQTLICSVCMTRKHKKHDVVDVDEYRKEELLENLKSAIEALSSKKEQFTMAQIKVERKNEECLKILMEEKRSTLSMVRNKYNSLIADVLKEKEKSSSKSGNEMTSLEEKLGLFSNIKQYVVEETLSLREVRNCQEIVSCTGYQWIQMRQMLCVQWRHHPHSYCIKTDRQNLTECAGSTAVPHLLHSKGESPLCILGIERIVQAPGPCAHQVTC